MRALLSCLVVAAVLAGCTDKGGVTVHVTGTDDACTADTASVGAGSVTFSFTNEASQVSELYVIRADGSVASEVENVATGTTRDLTVRLSGGTYTLTCKPGMAGDGISSTIDVEGKVDDAASTADREVEVVAKEYTFTPEEPLSISAGETVTIELQNQGTLEHELEVFDPSGEALGEVAPTAPGSSGRVTVTFADAGTYQFVCGIAGHKEAGMVLDVQVT